MTLKTQYPAIHIGVTSILAAKSLSRYTEKQLERVKAGQSA